ncbi:MAG TPA: hypothetical protein VE843_05470 [Ktedonobacteraceae bacterium]|nr:hypothetical protein [Ktedonobacteraceae bacterium]
MATNFDQMEEIWGQGAAYSEYQIDDHICYMLDGQMYIGTIIWVCAPTNTLDEQLPTRYIVQPDHKKNSRDIVLSSNIIADELEKQETQTNLLAHVSEQAIIEALATLSIPIFIREEIDDEGVPFYVWHLGEATPERPFGMCVGIHRQFSGALKLAIEKAIKGIQE